MEHSTESIGDSVEDSVMQGGSPGTKTGIDSGNSVEVEFQKYVEVLVMQDGSVGTKEDIDSSTVSVLPTLTRGAI